MTADYLLFIKVHNGFPEHRKTMALSDRAFRRLIEVWCMCSRNLNDGKLTDVQVSQLFSRKVRDELVAVGYLEQTDSGWEMHDYLDHQQSASQVADLRRKRAEAGRRGGRAKANHVASANGLLKQTPSKSLPDTDTDTDNSPTVSTRRAATRIPDPFEISQAMRVWASAEVPGLDIERSTRKFVDFWRGKSGKDATKLDWPATWRNWMRTDHDRAAPQSRPPVAATNGSRPGIPGVGMAIQI